MLLSNALQSRGLALPKNVRSTGYPFNVTDVKGWIPWRVSLPLPQR